MAPELTVVVRPATVQDMPRVGDILAQGFGDKFGIVFGRRVNRAPRVLAQLERLKLERGLSTFFVAEADGRVVGVIELSGRREHWTDSWRQIRTLWRKIGLLYTLRAVVGFLLLYEADPGDENTVYVSQIAVAHAFRGCGVGRKLLMRAESWGRARGQQNLALHVAATNRARHLYERFGFELKERSEEWVTERLFGIRAWLYMVKNSETKLI
ncbi:MAG: GNAT family N-acetyltransferase [Chloroflexi bacterium]|nr:GNAT family N-acetyltransferase [Chloroflexota bacterium]